MNRYSITATVCIIVAVLAYHCMLVHYTFLLVGLILIKMSIDEEKIKELNKNK